MSWQLAVSLQDLRTEINARWPGRDKTSDGSVGDTRHRATKSDHNPDGGGIVRAIDIDRDGPRGVDIGTEIAAALKASQDGRIKYVIFRGRMFSSYPTGSYPAWTWRPYSGINAHMAHVHVSVRAGHVGGRGGPWGVGARPVTPPAPKPAPVRPAPVPEDDVMSKLPRVSAALKSNGYHARLVQHTLNLHGSFPGHPLRVDGDFGPTSDRALRDKQRDWGITPDGDCGPRSWAHLLGVA